VAIEFSSRPLPKNKKNKKKKINYRNLQPKDVDFVDNVYNKCSEEHVTPRL